MLHLLLPACTPTPPHTPADTAAEDTGTGDAGTDAGDAGTDTATDTGTAVLSTVSLSLGPIRPLLAQDHEVELSVTLNVSEAAPGGLDLVLRGTTDEGLSTELARWSELPVEDAGLALSWKPHLLGLRTLQLDAEVDSTILGTTEGPRVAVTPTLLHVHHWYADAALHHWVSALLAPTAFGAEPGEDLAWRERGAEVLTWKGDDYAGSDATAFAAYLSTLSEGASGVVVDEMFTGTAGDQVVGQALQMVAASEPALFLAPYTQGASGASMIAGLRASDLVLVETYPADFRAYDIFESRLGEVVAAGLGDSAVAAVSLYEATHEAELRRQLYWLRNHFPDLPGIAFYGNAPSEALASSLDSLVEEAWLRAALTVELLDRTATVRNVGGQDAGTVTVRFFDEEGGLLESQELGGLPAGETVVAVSSAAAASVELELDADSTWLRWVDPREQTPDAEDAATWWEDLVRGATSTEVLAGRPELALELDGGGLAGASLPLPADTFALQAQLQVQRSQIYGFVGLGLRTGEALLWLSLYKGEDDIDLGSDQARLSLSHVDPAGAEVKDLLPAALAPGDYTVSLGFDGEAVRALLTDEDGTLIADTGRLAVDESLAGEELWLAVRPDGPSSVGWDPGGAEVLHLVGAASASYATEVHLSEVRSYAAP